MQEYLNVAINASLLAGAEIMKIYLSDDFDVKLKSDDSPLTKADLKSNEIIKETIDCFNLPFLSEEEKEIPFEKRKNWPLFWMVDPIDGTKEFIKRNGEFTINIALIKDGRPVLGVVYAPVLNTLFYASEETGSYQLEVKPDELHPKFENAKKLFGKKNKGVFTIVASKSHRTKETDDYIKELEREHDEIRIISKGSSLKLCLIANGEADQYPRFAPTMEWDTAAGHAVCVFAGKEVINWTTKETVTYNKSNLLNPWFLVK